MQGFLMIKITKVRIFLLLFMATIAYAKTPNNSVVVDRTLMTDAIDRVTSAEHLPEKNKEIFTNTDKAILYYVYFGIINSTKKKYQVDITCVDTKNNIIFKSPTEVVLKEVPDYIGEDIIKYQVQMLQLDTKPGAMVKGQLIPLKDDNDYFIKLYIEKKLVGVSNFTYQVINDVKQSHGSN